MPSAADAPTLRAQDPLFVRQCSLTALAAKLPLVWSSPPGTPPSPKRFYRSHYVYRGWADLRDPTTWAHLSDFDLCLRLIDFGGLRPVLAQRLGWTAARGWIPFDPVSLFLLHGWQITNTWNRSQTLTHLRDPRYADYAQRFGFENQVFPSEGGLRYVLTTLGTRSTTAGQTVSVAIDETRTVAVPVQDLNQLIAGAAHLIHDAGLMSPDTWRQAQVCPDGMLHDAASRLRCHFVQDSCYQPLTQQQPTRPCPAKAGDKPHRGCDCTTPACRQICRHATPRDPQARLVVYTGSNMSADNPNRTLTAPAHGTAHGILRYGYRSQPLQLVDVRWHTSYVLLDDFLPAPEREENPSAALLQQTPTFYPTLHIASTAGDAGLGYAAYLHSAYALKIKRLVDLRGHETDTNKEQWLRRGYDDKGRPLCAHGYTMSANGFDAQRQRHKWICAQACLTAAEPCLRVANAPYPPTECPYRTADHPSGQITNVGERFGDGSIRLVRDVAYDTPAWEEAYHRARNAVEGRQSTMERWDFKRLPVYGLPRSKALDFQADVWADLTTMARLVAEATMLAGGP
jgi:hypothetical protein